MSLADGLVSKAWVAKGASAGLAAVFVWHSVIPAARELTHGFAAYYTGARLVTRGTPAVRVYDEAWFADRVAEATAGRVRDIYLATPPACLVVWQPLASLPIETARAVWTWLNVGLLGAAAWVIARGLGLRRWSSGWVGLLALLTLSAPIREQVWLGQMYVLLLLVHALGWRAFSRGQDLLAGLAVGFAWALKLSGWPLGLVMLGQRRWRALGWTALAATGVMLVTLPLVGIEAWLEDLLVKVPAVIGSPAGAVSAYQTTASFWQRLFRFDPVYNRNPLVDVPGLAVVLTAATGAAACCALVFPRRSPGTAFLGGLALSELLSPAAEQYHYVLVLLPLAALWARMGRSRSPARLALALAATFLVCWPLSYKGAASGWQVLTLYPRLLGGWLTWSTLLWSEEEREGDGRSLPPRALA